MDDWLEIILVLVLGLAQILIRLGESFMGATWALIANLVQS